MIDFTKSRIREEITPAAFVMPQLLDADENGIRQIKPGQRLKPGMLVKVESRKSAWGSTSFTTRFAGVVLANDAEEVTVRPLAGAPGVSAVCRVSEYTMYRLEYGQMIENQSVRVSRRSVTIMNPEAFPSMSKWYENANKFAELGGNRRMIDYKAKLYAKLAMCEDQRRANDGVQSEGRKARFVTQLAGRKDLRSADYIQWFRNPDNKKKGKSVARGIHKFRKAEQGAMQLRDITFYASAARDLAVTIWNRDRTDPARMITRAGCAHLSWSSAVRRVIGGGHTNVCQQCAEAMLTERAYGSLRYHELLYRGDMVIADRDDYPGHEWEDGTLHVEEPPPVIGSYHSSKQSVGKLPNMDGSEFKGLTLGLELEMEVAPNSKKDRNAIARLMANRVKKARPEAWGEVSRACPGYAFFENDSSINNGYEMVTSYGSLDVHREMILSVFGPDNIDGPFPYAGLLRSHDAESSCGLHVHLAKPESLTHAAKLQAFYHDEGNKRLIRAVARRYAVNYARCIHDKGVEYLEANTKSVMRPMRGCLGARGAVNGYTKREQQQLVRQAITRLGDDNRYQQVNFNNDKTVEIRIFRGSMMPVTIIACLEFAAAVWHFTRYAKAEQLNIKGFVSYINQPDNRKDTRFLRGYLAQRGFDVWLPKPKKGEKAAVLMTEVTGEEA